MAKGILITFEGIDGSGKSTQVDMLCKKLSQQDIPHLKCRSPGSTTLGFHLRHMLKENSYDPVTQFLLFSAAEREMIVKVIQPALDRGEVVVCDRFCDSSFAYQGAGQKVPQFFISKVVQNIKRDLRPDITFLLDISYETMVERLDKRNQEDLTSPDVFESKGFEFYNRVIARYRKMSDEDSRFVQIDATVSEELLHGVVYEYVLDQIITYES